MADLAHNEEAKKCPYEECPCATHDHKEDHDFVRSAMRVMARLEDIKWSTLKALAVALAILVAGLIGSGLIEKIRGLLK